MRPVPAAVLTLALLLAGCTSADVPEVEVAEVRPGVVVQTVAAAARLEPAARVTVTAPTGGEVEELLVGDGDVVAAGDPLVRLASDAIDQQITQAEAAADAAGSLAGGAATAGFDLSPVVGAFRAQLDAVFPPLIGALGDQIDVLERTVETVRDTTTERLAELDPEELVELGLDPDDVAELGLDADPDELAERLDTTALEDALYDARRRLAEAEAGYRQARSQLVSAESQVRSQAQQATAAQQAAVEAQRQQAELALEAARARIDDLTIVAPVAGVVELSRGESGGAPATIPDVGGFGDLGGLDELGGLLGGTAGGESATRSGPIAEGVGVGPGQPVLTIYDLSSFSAQVDVDEIDIVEVEVGQDVTVLIDAFPGREFRGVVQRIALSPQRPAGGGAIFPVTVQLVDVPAEVQLRVGLTAAAEIEVRRVDGDTVVPTSALLRRGDDEVVHLLRDGRALQVPVEVDAIGDETAAVSGELSTGDEVITIGVELVEDGAEVEVVR